MLDAARSLLALDRRLWLLAIARSINTLGFSVAMPFMALYLVEERGQSAAMFGGIYLVAGLGASAAQAWGGELSDRHGRRKVMLGALAARTAVMLALGFAVLADAHVGVIAAGIIANGALRAVFDPAAAAAVADLAPAGQRVAAFGLQRVGINAGWAIGPALGGFLAEGSYGAVFFLAAPLTALAIAAVVGVHDVPAARVRDEAPGLIPMLAALREDRRFVTWLVLVLCGSILIVQFFTLLSLHASGALGMSKAEVGLLYTVNGLGVIVLQLPAVAIVSARGPSRSLVLGAGLFAVGFLGFGVATTFGGVAAAIVVFTVGEVLFAPALSDLAAYLGDPKRMGRAFGAFGLTQQLGVAVGPLVGGLLHDSLGDRSLVMWGTVAAGTVGVTIGYAVFLQRNPLTPERAEAA